MAAVVPARRTTDGQSVIPAIGRWPTVQEYQDSGRSDATSGDSDAYDSMR